MKTGKVLVTGSAGFIGFHVAQRLLREGKQVLGLDNLNAYYDVNLKCARLAQLRGQRGFRFVMADLADQARMERLFAEEPFDCVIHSGRAGRSTLLLDEPARLHPVERGRVHPRAGRLPARTCEAPGLRLFQLSVRSQPAPAILGSR